MARSFEDGAVQECCTSQALACFCTSYCRCAVTEMHKKRQARIQMASIASSFHCHFSGVGEAFCCCWLCLLADTTAACSTNP